MVNRDYVDKLSFLSFNNKYDHINFSTLKNRIKIFILNLPKL